MAIVQTLETLYEAAVVAALTANADINGTYTVQAADKQSAAEDYPLIIVRCVAAEDVTSGSPDGYDLARVDIICMTDKNDDLDGATVNTMIGAVRDTWRGASILSALEGGGGLNILGTAFDGESYRNDETDTRYRAQPVTVTGSAVVDVPA